MRRSALLLVLTACAGDSVSQTEAEVDRIMADVVPRVEGAAGLTFKSQPATAVRTREQVEAFLTAKLDAEYPPELLDDIAVAYRLFGVLPDTIDLRSLFLTVLSEQVIGYYDPDSTTLYVVDGAEPFQIRLVLAHELVHALQGQYMPLDSILGSTGENDRKMAAQAVLEGQATFASLLSTLPADQVAQLSNFWRDIRESVRQEQERMPAFSGAPLIIREGLIFPYLAGADFVRWFSANYPDTVPFGPRLPTSTEQILHPEKYRAGDQPTVLRIGGQGGRGAEGQNVTANRRSADPPIYEDTWGEFETRIVLTELTGSESMGNAGALGWDGDRFAVYQAGEDYALVWWSVWDSDQAALKFAGMLERGWEGRAQAGRRWTVIQSVVDGMSAVRLLDAPEDWWGWSEPPGVVVAR